MSAMVASAIRRRRLASSERAASAGFIACARAMISPGSGALLAMATQPSMSGARGPAMLFRRGQVLASVPLERGDHRVGRHDIAEGEIECAERGLVVLVG